MRDKLKFMLLEILRGGESRHYRTTSLARVMRDEDGLITWATLIAVVLFMALIGIVFNVGRITNDKLEAQNAADSVAYSASLVQARAMNAVTTTNHMMGELTALYTMHHALVEKNRKSWNIVTIALASTLTVEEPIAQAAGAASMLVGGSTPPSFASNWWDIPYGSVSVYDAKCLVKWKIIEQYLKHAIGSGKVITGAPWFLPPPLGDSHATYRDGLRMQSQASAEIRLLKIEYRIVHGLQQFARNTMAIKNTIPHILSALYLYERLIAGDFLPGLGTEYKCAQAASEVAQANRCVGEVLGRPTAGNIAAARLGIPSAKLPLVKDPTQDPERTQLIRATYPWVQEWRAPMIAVMYFPLLPKSRMAIFYEYHTDRFTKELCQQFGYKLFVLEQMDATHSSTDKGTESWRQRDQSRLADEMFAVVGIARRKAPPGQSHMNFLLPRTNPIPVAAFSQAMIYNGNRPEKWEPDLLDMMMPLIRRRAQPVEGWDTLGWTEGATEWKNGKPYVGWPEALTGWIPSKVVGGFFEDLRWVIGRIPPIPLDLAYPPDARVPTPKVQLNWQAKLVPVAEKTFFYRSLMVRDEAMQTRVKQVWPVVNPFTTSLPESLRPQVINH